MIEKKSTKADNAWKFISWASSQKYEELAGSKQGWANIPAGKRASTYENAEYKKAAGAFADPTLEAIKNADPTNPGVQPRPTVGIQFVDVPEFTDVGQKVSQDVSAVIAGQKTVDEALNAGQTYAEQKITKVYQGK
jgi:sorbitol/mannitol transport system substrate-binding protein